MRLMLDPAEVQVLVSMEQDLNETARAAHAAATVDELKAIVADQGILTAKYLHMLFGIVVQEQDPAEIMKEHHQR